MKTVMIVEDDAVYRQALGRALHRSGYTPIEAPGVEAARHALADARPTHAVVDLALPDGSGIDVVRALTDQVPGCRVVLLTAHGTIPATVEAMRAGACDVRTKPISTDALVLALETAEATHDHDPLDQVTADHVQRVLDAVDGNVSEAARRLGLHRRTLQRRIRSGRCIK
ncbi:MAG: response regulator [Alphaproteobacteria bacterium]|nr:response regulator [Alphaproteobacteria bacterium]